jgi:hypothetical protein
MTNQAKNLHLGGAQVFQTEAFGEAAMIPSNCIMYVVLAGQAPSLFTSEFPSDVVKLMLGKFDFRNRLA